MSKNETKGWECPRCHRVYAPWKDKCDYCGNSTNTSSPICPYYWRCCPHDWSITTSASSINPDAYINTTAVTNASTALNTSNILKNEVKS